MIFSDKMIRKKMKHYNEPGHAHELTFSFYRRRPYGNDPFFCRIFLEELDSTRKSQDFLIWAYVIMPSHVHMLIYPKSKEYDIAEILQHIKGKTSNRYRNLLKDKNPKLLEDFSVILKGNKTFRLWQAGGGFDRNLWNAEPIHKSIKYIESNPVRARFVENPEDWEWSSAYAWKNGRGVIPDSTDIPMFMKM